MKESKLAILFSAKYIRSRKSARICKASLFPGHKRVLREDKVIAEKLSELCIVVHCGRIWEGSKNQNPFLVGNSSEDQSEIEITVEEIWNK